MRERSSFGQAQGSRFALLILASLARCTISAASSTIPSPIVISPSQYWEGNDGTWSTFTIQVGTPAQNVRVLISTAGSATWVVDPEGCPVAAAISNCAELRGQTFNANASSTWKFNDFFHLVLESNLNYTGTGSFGFDKVGIGWQGDGGPVLENQVVAGIATDDFWLGSFGLTPRPTNFTDFNDPQPSFMQTLKNRSLIPSLSWSYTAGAPYRLDKVLGSLIFGGYDAAKAGTTNITIDFGPDISRDLQIGLQGIRMEASDSTVPHIWLPQAACINFENELGLRWNHTVGLYLLNDTLHERLLSRNASFAFKIGNVTEGTPTIEIVLPYASLDLTVDYPIVANRTRYFPIMRAANDTQYILGRTFLQEAYLTVDYERSEFYLSQTRFDPGASEHIVSIPSLNSTLTETSPKKAISTSAIAGTAVGGAIALAALAAIIFLFMRRRRLTRSKDRAPDYPAETPGPFEKAELDAGETAKPENEIGGTAVEFFQPDKDQQSELPDSSVASPVSPHDIPVSEPIYEMTGDQPVLPELPVGPTKSKETS